MFNKNCLTDYEDYLLRKIVTTVIRLIEAEDKYIAFTEQFLYQNTENISNARVRKHWNLIEDLLDSISSIVDMEDDESDMIISAIYQNRDVDEVMRIIHMYLDRINGLIATIEDEPEVIIDTTGSMR